MATTHFENVDLLKSLMGGGRPQTPASRLPAPAASPPPPAASQAAGSCPSHDALGIPPAPLPASPRPTTAGGPGPKWEAPPPRTTTTTTTPHGSGGAPPPYQAHAPPAAKVESVAPGREAAPAPSAASAGAGSVRAVSTPSSPALSLASLPGYEAQAAPAPSPPGAALPPPPSGRPDSQASSGLKALFQAPVPLGFRDGKPPPRPTFGGAPRRQSAPPPKRSNGGGPGPEPLALSPMSSVASFHSLVAEGGIISELEGDSCLLLLPPRPASYSAPGNGPGAGPRRISSPLPQTGAARHGGRSPFFVYKPRPPPTALVADAISESPADTLVFELDGSGVCRGPPGPPPRGQVAESPEEEKEGAGDAAGSRGEERTESAAGSAPDASGGTNPAPVRRGEVESAAWHRRTKMFQV